MVIDKEKDKALKESLREKYMKNGLSALSEKELTELLLTYSAAGNFEELADNLLSSYSSLRSMLAADFHHISRLTEGDDRFAVLLKLIPQLSRIYHKENKNISNLKSSEQAKAYFKSFYIAAPKEMLTVVCTNEHFDIRDSKVIATGEAGKVSVSVREIADFAINCRAPYMFMSHNHPCGNPEPSSADIGTTVMISETLKMYGITLIDHIIVAGKKAISLRESNHAIGFIAPLPDNYKISVP